MVNGRGMANEPHVGIAPRARFGNPMQASPQEVGLARMASTVM